MSWRSSWSGRPLSGSDWLGAAPRRCPTGGSSSAGNDNGQSRASGWHDAKSRAWTRQGGNGGCLGGVVGSGRRGIHGETVRGQGRGAVKHASGFGKRNGR
jgi:hypothetical protein